MESLPSTRRGTRSTNGTDSDVEYTLPVEVELSEIVVEQLAERAKSLGIRPEELARAAVADWVSRPAERFNLRHLSH